MNFRSIQCAILFFVSALSVNAAITITVDPDGSGGTAYTFTQTSPNPTLSIELVSASGIRMELPPGMFNPTILGSIGSTDTYGNFEKIAQFQDIYSGFSYDIVELIISNTFSYASFGFRYPLARDLDQTQVQFNLLPDIRGVLGISPAALIGGIHVMESPLFGTVTVNVIPEPSILTILVLGAFASTQRRPHRQKPSRHGTPISSQAFRHPLHRFADATTLPHSNQHKETAGVKIELASNTLIGSTVFHNLRVATEWKKYRLEISACDRHRAP